VREMGRGGGGWWRGGWGGWPGRARSAGCDERDREQTVLEHRGANKKPRRRLAGPVRGKRALANPMCRMTGQVRAGCDERHKRGCSVHFGQPGEKWRGGPFSATQRKQIVENAAAFPGGGRTNFCGG